MAKELNFKQKSEKNFLVYAYSVIKARAISNVEDNLKPVHRRILFGMGQMKLFSDAKFVKCARVVGEVMGKYHPHGDASIYDALVRLSQPWKMRYPLTEVQGNAGNIIGDGPAASRYTNCRLSPFGDLMLEGLDSSKIPMVDNYDGSFKEPVLLPSIFPNILCNGNMGIAVGLSASLVPHNLREVCNAIKARINGEDPLSYIKGPDFPTAGKIINAENLAEIYRTGRGTIKVQAHYSMQQKDGKVNIVFTDLPYGVEIEDGVIKPLKKFILEEGCDYFDNYIDETSDYNKVSIRIVLSKGTDPAKALAILFDKTSLESTVSINNTVLENNEPRMLGMVAMIDDYINYRSAIIKGIAENEAIETQHKLTVATGLQKCTSNIDKLIQLIRASDDKMAAKKSIMQFFSLNEEQADAVLDMKLVRLSHLDVKDISDSVSKYSNKLTQENDIVNNEATRKNIICQQLTELSDKYGDDRRTEICLSDVAPQVVAKAIARPMFVYSDIIKDEVNPNAIQVVVAKSASDYFGYDSEANLYASNKMLNCVGANKLSKDKLFITVSKNGLIKVSNSDEYESFRGKACKIKEGDSLLYCGYANAAQYVLVIGQNKLALKIPVSELTITGRMSQGTMLGVGPVMFAAIVNNEDSIMMIDSENKAKLTSIEDFSENSRTSKGQDIMPNIRSVILATGRDTFYGFTNTDKVIEIPASKLSMKGKTAGGASTTARTLKKII